MWLALLPDFSTKRLRRSRECRATVGNLAPLRRDERRRAENFRLIFSPSEAVNDVHDDDFLYVMESLSVIIYDVDQPAWAR